MVGLWLVCRGCAVGSVVWVEASGLCCRLRSVGCVVGGVVGGVVDDAVGCAVGLWWLG